ncbi:2'-5' RNA ligase family protein [Imperialibacter roseus]|uniref:2'-5' RNA ligase family protein n=1 Tax=Imperialibacter roseus TaxID=1324217 RepID=A0ABZ0IP07_9BACT|nr:2'-5' RNA ligase family protein [Imperialibacter roseus]WOK05725.1 2'-5' RNA ligase family protein [Imperialibacter roseus]
MVTYKIQIYPSQSITDYVRDRKAQILDEFGQYKFYNSHPHVSLFSFQADISNEHLITKALKEASVFVDSFDISLNGFGYLKSNRAIYLKIGNGSQVARINQLFYRKFRESAKSFGIRVIDPVFAKYPHMIIGSEFEQKAFLKVHQTFIDQKYRETFAVDQVRLLRDIGNGKNDFVETISLTEKVAVSLKWPEEKVWMVNEPQMSLFSHVA